MKSNSKNNSKHNKKKKIDLSVLLPVCVVVLMMAFLIGGFVYTRLTDGPDSAAEAYLESMMERDGNGIINSYCPEMITYVSRQTGDSPASISQRVQKRIDTWYDSKILSVCGAVTSYETELLSTEDADEEELSRLEAMTGLSISRAVICRGKITARGEKGEAVSEQQIYLMKIDDAWYLYGMGLLA